MQPEILIRHYLSSLLFFKIIISIIIMIVIVIIIVIDIIIFLSSILPLSLSLLKKLFNFFIRKCPLTFSFPYFALPQKQEHLRR